MINYVERGIGLHEYLASEGVFIEQGQDGTWYTNASEERTNNLIASYNPWPTEKEKKLKELNTNFDEAVLSLTKGTTQPERDSWAVQVSEAYGERPLSMLRTMAEARGISVEALAAKVKEKAAAYSAAYGSIQGARDAIEDVIKTYPNEGSYELLQDFWRIKCTVSPQ